MAFVIKTLKVLRNNWKKSTLAAVVLSYGGNRGRDKYRSIKLMREYCEEAQTFGDVPLQSGKKPRHVTVILNPAAKDGKGKKLFENFAAPLFHLAGIKLSVVQTEHEGQAKDLMEVMDNTDAVVIAGGDGTVSDVLTGLLRRDDEDFAVKRFPLGVIPIGKTNTAARYLFLKDSSAEVRWIAEAAMAVIKENYQSMDIMHIQSDGGKPIYAIGKIDLGVFRDTNNKISKYWYWGPLKSQMAYLFSLIKNWPTHIEVNMNYVLPCAGCSKCRSENPTLNEMNLENRRWWHAFIRPKPMIQMPVVNSIDYSSITNEECGVYRNKQSKATEVTVATKHAFEPIVNTTDACLQIRIVQENLTRSQFFSEGLTHSETGKASDDITFNLKASEIQIEPVAKSEEESWYSIDNEAFEVRPISVKLLPKKVNFYCN
uniref:Acylglycerol kinase, mitochondrial n=1 Tax=Strigamia maritima TaxID=126957 RepID=T1IWW9_STRMM